MSQTERIEITIKMVWQDRPTILRDIDTGKKVKCNMTEGLFNTLFRKINLQYSEVIKSLQF